MSLLYIDGNSYLPLIHGPWRILSRWTSCTWWGVMPRWPTRPWMMKRELPAWRMPPPLGEPQPWKTATIGPSRGAGFFLETGFDQKARIHEVWANFVQFILIIPRDPKLAKILEHDSTNMFQFCVIILEERPSQFPWNDWFVVYSMKPLGSRLYIAPNSKTYPN